MPAPSIDLHLDFETYCDLDLRTVGIHRYVEHPSFRVLAAAWKAGGRLVKTRVLPPLVGARPHIPMLLAQALQNANVQGHAWNAAFEAAVLRVCGVTPANPLSCTMQRALAYGLPGKLEAAGAALGLAIQKDMAGHRLMLKMTKPVKKTGAEGAWTGVDHAVLVDYCGQDVEAEEAVGVVIPPLQGEERELSLVDAVMNERGVAIGPGRVDTLIAVADAATKDDSTRCAVLTAGAVTSPGTQTDRLMKWLAAEGLALPDVARATIEDALITWKGTANWAVISEVLAIRLRAARGSTRKLARMNAMALPGSILQGQFQFCGAGRTGRWSGRGVQVQNLPRVPKGFSPDAFLSMAARAVMDGGKGLAASLNAVTVAPILDCVAWSLRACLVPRPGMRFWGFDFSQIEARVLAWLAGQNDVLDVFRSGEDVYVWAAAQFGSKDRQLGKVLILALGFGMGAAKLMDTARKSYGVILSAAQAESFKSSWRSRNSRIVSFWYAMEDAAKQAILNRGRVYAVGGSGVAFQCTARTLQMRLPSGRVLYYHKPRLEPGSGSIRYWGTEVGGRWVELTTYGGKLAENATQAVARDIMSEAMLRIYRRTQRVPVMTVHDELVYEIATDGLGFGAVARELERQALSAPPWAGGLPIAGEAKKMTRYGVVEV